MDGPSLHIVEFLGALQEARMRLSPFWNQLMSRGVVPAEGSLFGLSASPYGVHDGASSRVFLGCIFVGLAVRGTNGQRYELVVELLWDAQGWTLTTEAWGEGDDGYNTLLRALPERTAGELPSCLEQLRSAVDDLATFNDLIP
jgi:hypothetical protein